MSGHVIVVGASMSGLRAAEQLRAAGHDGSITVIGDEPYLPYNRPPLSKEALAREGAVDGVALHETIVLRRRASIADVEFRLGEAVTAASLADRTVTLAGGDVAAWDGLVVATGLRPRRLALDGPQQGRHVLRALDHCVALRGTVRPGLRVVVIGGGFIGSETAATLVGLGCEVTVVEPFGAPMERALGPEVAAAVQRHHERHGVRFVLGDALTAIEGSGHVEAVALASGERLAADLVIESIGSVCNTGWLEGNDGLDLRDGVLCDNALRVVGAERVVAVGDLARFPNPLFDDVPRRVEHWAMATDSAKRAARTLVADIAGEEPSDEAFAPIPNFWSDQFDLRFQAFGSPALGEDRRIVEGDLDDLLGGVVAAYHRDDGRQVATVAINVTPARLRELREPFQRLAA